MTNNIYIPLVTEQQVFVDNLTEWLPKREEQWVWINGQNINFYKTYEEAIESVHKEGNTQGPVFVEEIIKGYQLKLFPGRIFI